MRLWGTEKRSEPGRARGAPQQHTWRICASAARSAQRVMRQARIGSIAGQSTQRISNFGNAPVAEAEPSRD
jgi:hypothetical protein